MENVKNVIPAPGVVVLEDVESKETQGGLALPDSQAKQNLQGKILAIGETLTNEHGVSIVCPFSIGDIVFYRKYAEQEIEVDWKKYTLAKFSDLLAKVE